jgi:hypothetical protein
MVGLIPTPFIPGQKMGVWVWGFQYAVSVFRFQERPVEALTKNQKPDGFVKSPNFLLRCIPRCFSVRQVRIIAWDLRASNLELFSLPSKFDFLRFYEI